MDYPDQNRSLHFVNGSVPASEDSRTLTSLPNGSPSSISVGHVNPVFEADESSTDPVFGEDKHENNNTSLPPDYAQTQLSASRPVVYDNRGGHNVVFQETVMTQQADGSRAINTRELPERGRSLQRPLRARRITLLKVFSIVAVVLFFPTGVPACYYAFRTKKAFNEGLMQGTIDVALKYASRAERFIILSVVLCIVCVALALAMWERSMNASKYTFQPGMMVG